MDETAIQAKLDRLADLRAAHDALALQKKALVDTILTDEVKSKLIDIDAEFAPKLIAAAERADALEAEVRQDILTHGATVRGKFIQAVWAKGRTTWDTSALVGYAVAHPEMSVFKKTGEPSVSIKVVK